MIRHQPVHLYMDDTIYFITAKCYSNLKPMLSNGRKSVFKDAMKNIFSDFGYNIYAWVILPNHYHVLTKSRQGTDLSKIIQYLHGRTSRNWNKEDRTPSRKVWTNYWDYCPRNMRDLYQHFNYIHLNPVKHGYVSRPEDWEYSTYNWYMRRNDRDWMMNFLKEWI